MRDFMLKESDKSKYMADWESLEKVTHVEKSVGHPSKQQPSNPSYDYDLYYNTTDILYSYAATTLWPWDYHVAMSSFASTSSSKPSKRT